MSLPDEFPELEENQIYGIEFTPNTEVENLNLYYDHRGDDREWITLHPADIEGSTVYFLSGEAPDPLEVNMETMEVYDSDTDVLIGTDAEIITATKQK